jgi:hypothetical protein
MVIPQQALAVSMQSGTLRHIRLDFIFHDSAA